MASPPLSPAPAGRYGGGELACAPHDHATTVQSPQCAGSQGAFASWPQQQAVSPLPQQQESPASAASAGGSAGLQPLSLGPSFSAAVAPAAAAASPCSTQPCMQALAVAPVPAGCATLGIATEPATSRDAAAGAEPAGSSVGSHASAVQQLLAGCEDCRLLMALAQRLEALAAGEGGSSAAHGTDQVGTGDPCMCTSQAMRRRGSSALRSCMHTAWQRRRTPDSSRVHVPLTPPPSTHPHSHPIPLPPVAVAAAAASRAVLLPAGHQPACLPWRSQHATWRPAQPAVRVAGLA